MFVCCSELGRTLTPDNPTRDQKFLNSKTLQMKQPTIETSHSTYHWICNLDPKKGYFKRGQFYLNTVPQMTGYSQFKGHAERMDKDNLLKRILCNVLGEKGGYLDRSTSIELFWNETGLVNKRTDPKLITLFPLTVQLHHTAIITQDWSAWFVKYFDIRKKGGDLKQLIPNPKASFSKDLYLSLDFAYTKIQTEMKRLHIDVITALNNYCDDLMTARFAPGEVLQFFRKYCEHYKIIF